MRDLPILAVFALLLVGLLFAPLLVRSDADAEAAAQTDAERLIIITPHVPQIREEFGRAFSRWHEANHGTPVSVDFRAPGGTSEIRRQLEAQYKAAISDGLYAVEEGPDGISVALEPGAVEYDLFFGGGTYDHDQLRIGVRVMVDLPSGEEVEYPLKMSRPAGFTQEQLDAWYGENAIGPSPLYHPEQYWLGVCVSSFGIVFNRDRLESLGLEEPDSFYDLGDPRLVGEFACADPRMSGSIVTTLDSILGNEGWERGWDLLRAMSGNSRSLTRSSTKPPMDVASGQAAVGLAIDFYGRGQAQAVADGGDPDRIGYTDPAGAVYIDPDPVTPLNGGPNPELASRFIEFCLSEQGQALWQFRATERQENDPTPDLGPDKYELRRLPIRRVMYERHFEHFVDQVDPYEMASDVRNPGWRTGVQMMMGAFAVEAGEECRRAWAAISRATADPEFPPERLEAMREAFFSFPETPVTRVEGHPAFGALSDEARASLGESFMMTFDALRRALDEGEVRGSDGVLAELAAFADAPPVALPFTEATYRDVRNEWRDQQTESRLGIAYTRYFREAFRRVEAMERGEELARAR